MCLAKRNVDFLKPMAIATGGISSMVRLMFLVETIYKSAFILRNNKRKYKDKVCYLLKKGDQRCVEPSAFLKKAGLRYPEMLSGEYLLHSGH